ncbi:two-component response regulator 24-like [Salvia divinorum]|uniref:Two-component response regulator 24-like n=1 Tax=Salvia divinorum TaxID=28513 RepID=A0ABD1HWE2_SALDI
MKKGGRKISALVVDDDRVIRVVEEKLLVRFGLETKVAKNGKEALDLFVAGNTFDFVVMDMEMPVMDGPEATRALRARGVDCMIVGVTSRGDGPEKAEFEAAGLNCCWEKPLNAQIVGTILDKLAKKLS